MWGQLFGAVESAFTGGGSSGSGSSGGMGTSSGTSSAINQTFGGISGSPLGDRSSSGLWLAGGVVLGLLVVIVLRK